MTQHTQHPDTHRHGLMDGCPRCAEHAAHPFQSLDADNLRALVARTRAWMRDEAMPRSDTERDAMRQVERFLQCVGVLERMRIKVSS